jgi:hypothetical protein
MAAIEPVGLSLAEKFAVRANQASKGKEAYVLATLARILFLEGKKEEAIQHQEEAVKAAEDNYKPSFQETLDSYRKGILPKLE